MAGKTEFHSIRYDALRKEYRVHSSWEKSAPVVEKDFLQAQKLFYEIKGLDIIALSRLKKGTHYQLRLKSELQDRSYLFSGASWEFETDWYTINAVPSFIIPARSGMGLFDGTNTSRRITPNDNVRVMVS